MQWCLLVISPCQDGVGSVLDEERGREGVPSHYCQVEKTVARSIKNVQVTSMAHKSVGYAFIAVEQGQVEGDVLFVITLIKLLGQLYMNVHTLYVH